MPPVFTGHFRLLVLSSLRSDLLNARRTNYSILIYNLRLFFIDNFAIGLYKILNETMANEPQGQSAQQQDLKQDLLVDPLPSDVMLGRGRAFLRHPGNQRLNTVVQKNMDRYLKARNRNEKTLITVEIVQIVQTYGTPPARFLRYKAKTRGWYEVDDEEARVKVSHTVRYRRRCIERHDVSESTESLSSHSGEEPVTVVEQTMSPVSGAHQLQHVNAGVNNSASSPLMLADLESDAAIFTDLGSDFVSLPSEQRSDFNQYGDFVF